MMFDHARDHVDLYQALVGSCGGPVDLGAIRQTLPPCRANLLSNKAAAARHQVSQALATDFKRAFP
jgi:hypothetical protein